MADELRADRSSSSAPSLDPLDAALERLEAARSADQTDQGGAQASEPEVDEDETTRTATTAESDPDDDDLEDDDEPVAANTPENDVEDDDEASQEPKQQTRAAQTSTAEEPKKQTQGKDSDDDDPPLSRKQRGKLITELRQELEQEQEARKRLEQSERQRHEEDERLTKEVDRALGTQEDYDKALEDGLNGDTDAQERARIWKANRAFYQKLLTKSQRDASEGFTQTYWSEVAGLPGVTEAALKAPSLSAVLKNIYDAGVASVKDSAGEEVEQLKKDVATWRGRYRTLKTQAGGTKTSPLGGGGSTAAEAPIDWRKKYIKNGVLTDEAEAIVSQYGFEALQNPKLIKAR